MCLPILNASLFFSFFLNENNKFLAVSPVKRYHFIAVDNVLLNRNLKSAVDLKDYISLISHSCSKNFKTM